MMQMLSWKRRLGTGKLIITEDWTKINNTFTSAGIQPHIYIVDNEASDHLKAALAKKDVAYQLVLPHCHRSYLSERAIQKFKKHLKAGVVTTDPDFPIAEWDKLITQVEITLNLLRATKVIHRLSVCFYIFRQFEFNVTPMATLGTKVLVHLKPGQRPTQALHWEQGWTTSQAPQHYRCLTYYFLRKFER